MRPRTLIRSLCRHDFGEGSSGISYLSGDKCRYWMTVYVLSPGRRPSGKPQQYL